MEVRGQNQLQSIPSATGRDTSVLADIKYLNCGPPSAGLLTAAHNVNSLVLLLKDIQYLTAALVCNYVIDPTGL